MKLNELKLQEKAKIKEIYCANNIKRRLLDLGMVKGTEIKPVLGKVKAGETIKLNATITADVANAKDFEIEGLN